MASARPPDCAGVASARFKRSGSPCWHLPDHQPSWRSMASVYKRGDTWWIRFQYRGKRFAKTARTTKKAEALRYLVRLQEETRQRDFGDRPRRTFKEMIDRYRAEHLPQLRP